MMRGDMGETAGPAPRRRTAVVVDVAVAVAAFTASTLGFASWWSRRLFEPAVYRAYYRQGVYRPRVVGRELVWQVHRAIGDPIGDHLYSRVPGARPGELLTAYLLVNGAAFAGTCVLLGRLLRRWGPGEPARTLVYVTVVVAVALSGYVVTPYDQVGYLLLLGVLLAVDLRPPYDLAAPVLALLAVANRETALLALAALLAAVWPADGAPRSGALAADEPDGRVARRRTLVVAVGVVTVVGYVVLRIAPGGDEPVRLWQSVTLAGNVGRLAGWVGLVVIVALAAWWWSVCDLARFGRTADAGAAVRRLWLWAIPYLLVAGLTGYWFEVRLFIPILVAECWVRARTDARMSR